MGKSSTLTNTISIGSNSLLDLASPHPPSIAGISNDLKVRFVLKQRPETVPHDLVVVGEKNPYHRHVTIPLCFF